MSSLTKENMSFDEAEKLLAEVIFKVVRKEMKLEEAIDQCKNNENVRKHFPDSEMIEKMIKADYI
tara:strand:- start:323 stop:517 length:195 start_codon:yes stop_codon:yes gene_type:complete